MAAGYKGRFGKESAWEFFQKDDWYEKMFITYGDPRTTDLFWLGTPEPALIIVVLYLAFVVIAPRVMASRPPMDLKRLIVVYNFAMVALSAYMCAEFFLTTASMGYSYFCQGVDWSYPTDPLSMRLVHVNWLFFMSKIIELADTVFFILRKKDNQVTFLHVYHHATMVVNWWMAAKYLPVGQSFFVGMINSWIHTLMYVYYALAALGPSMQKYLWWKKHMTTLQLVQFVAVISHTSYNKFVRTDCDYPYLYNSIVFYYTWSMVVLFSHFFYTTYVSSKRSPSSRQPTSAKPVTANKLSERQHTTNGFISKSYNGLASQGPNGDFVENNNITQQKKL
jgi:elongation of very long chain fatty acids protein 4